MKKIIAIVICAVMVFSLAFSLVGCGENLNEKYRDSKVGDVIEFGKDSNGNRIKWVVFERDSLAIHLTSLDIIDYKPYISNSMNKDYSKFSNSDLGLWLNGDFYNDSFSTNEKEIINEIFVLWSEEETPILFSDSNTIDGLEKTIPFWFGTGELFFPKEKVFTRITKKSNMITVSVYNYDDQLMYSQDYTDNGYCFDKHFYKNGYEKESDIPEGVKEIIDVENIYDVWKSNIGVRPIIVLSVPISDIKDKD